MTKIMTDKKRLIIGQFCNKHINIIVALGVLLAFIGVIYAALTFHFFTGPISKKETQTIATNPTNNGTDKNPIKRDNNKPKHNHPPPLDNKKATSSPTPEKEQKLPQLSINATDSNVVTGPVTGNVNQSVNVNEAIPPEWLMSPSEQISDNEWRTMLSAKARGRLPYANWNLLLTLNTAILRREDVPDKVSVGPWVTLGTTGNLKPNNFFIGFSEFRVGQHFSIYLYSKEPLKVLHVESLSE